MKKTTAQPYEVYKVELWDGTHWTYQLKTEAVTTGTSDDLYKTKKAAKDAALQELQRK